MRGEEYLDYLRSLLRAGRGVLAAPMKERATRVRAPTLVVWGARDLLVPATGAKALGRLVPGARVLVYERSGHVPMVDQAERFNRDVIDFLDE